jgi:hypothetical protein
MNNDDHNEHAEGLLRQVWNNHLPGFSWDRAVWFTSSSWDGAFVSSSWDGAFIIDESLPVAIVRSLHPMPAEMAAALDCWRSKMVTAIDNVVRRYKTVTAVDEEGNITWEAEPVQRAAASNDET